MVVIIMMKKDMECKDSIEYRVYSIESRKKKKRKIINYYFLFEESFTRCEIRILL